MSQMIEAYLGDPPTADRDCVIKCASLAGGKLTHEESGEGGVIKKGLCLTFEFETLPEAERAIEALSSKGVHVEGPYDY
jgi:hypothetical protein